MTEDKELLLLAAKNRAVSRCWLSHSSTGQVAAATAGLLWPAGAIVGGTAGVVAVAGFAAAALAGSVLAASRESAAIETEVRGGNYSRLGEYLTPSDLDDLKRKAIALGVAAEPEKKISPSTGQSLEPGSKTPAPESGGAVTTLPRAVVQLDEAAPHLLLVGRTREGKSETLKYLLGSERKVWYVTSKVTDRVPQHWRGYRVGGPQLGGQVDWLLDQWEASLLSHLEGNDTTREWVVIDEAVGILQSLRTKGHKATSERLRGFLVEAVTAGAAVSSFVGLLSQTGNAGPLGIAEDLLKNFSVVTCGKRKKSQMARAFCKLTDLRLTDQQQEEILSLDGYWQLWENGGPCLSQVPLSQVALKEVVACPTGDGLARPASPSHETLVREILGRASSPLRASEVRKMRRAFKDGMTLPQVENLLTGMVRRGILAVTTETPPRYYLNAS